MTGPLRNVRWERFVQALFEGQNITSAYATAGYVRDDGNATRLRNRPAIQERLVELQEAAAKEAKITVASLLDELEEARKRADSLDQLSTVVKAVSEKARISGLLVQKIEIGAAGDFGACETVEAVVDELLKFSLNPSYEVATERERQELIDMTERHFAEMQEVIAAIKAKPIDPAFVHKAQRKALRHLGNGKA
jgi:hypothetical protein